MRSEALNPIGEGFRSSWRAGLATFAFPRIATFCTLRVIAAGRRRVTCRVRTHPVRHAIVVYPTHLYKGAWMREPTGHYLPLPGPRKFIGDLVHFARRIPSAPVARTFDVSAVSEARVQHSATVVVVPVHEGLCARGLRECSAPAIAAGVSVAEAIRAPMDELRDGDREGISRRGGSVCRDIPGTGAADFEAASGVGGLVQE